MAIRRLKKDRFTHGGSEMYRSVFALDSDADIASLPTSSAEGGGFLPVAQDSMAVVIGDGGGAKILMLNGSDEWVEV